jgi:hypothetical protein
VGLQFPYCSYDRFVGKADNFRANYFNLQSNFGLLLRLQQDRWILSAGVSSGFIGWGFRMTYPINQGILISETDQSAASIYYHRFPLFLSYNWQKVRFLKLNGKQEHKKHGDLYLLAFHIQPSAGFSIDRLGGMYNKSTLSDPPPGMTQPSLYINYYRTVEIMRHTNLSLLAGLGFQFYNRKGNPTWHLFLYYSKGMFNVVNVTVNYQLGNESYRSLLHSKGNIVGFQVSHQIRLKRFAGDKKFLKILE